MKILPFPQNYFLSLKGKKKKHVFVRIGRQNPEADSELTDFINTKQGKTKPTSG